MGNFNRGDRSGGGGFKGGEQSGRPTMHRATCADCGKSCEVPFKPTGDKPVYCSICFGNKDTSNKSRNERRRSERSSFRDKPMFKAVCDKCHQECEVPFKPTGDKPVFCNSCFGKPERRGGSGGSAAGADQHRKQFEILNNKLDNILEMLSSGSAAKKVIKKEKPVITAVKKIVEKKSKVKKVVAAKKAAPKKTVKKKAAVKKTVKKAAAKKKK